MDPHVPGLLVAHPPRKRNAMTTPTLTTAILADWAADWPACANPEPELALAADLDATGESLPDDITWSEAVAIYRANMRTVPA